MSQYVSTPQAKETGADDRVILGGNTSDNTLLMAKQLKNMKADGGPDIGSPGSVAIGGIFLGALIGLGVSGGSIKNDCYNDIKV